VCAQGTIYMLFHHRAIALIQAFRLSIWVCNTIYSCILERVSIPLTNGLQKLMIKLYYSVSIIDKVTQPCLGLENTIKSVLLVYQNKVSYKLMAMDQEYILQYENLLFILNGAKNQLWIL
jgi:hypothetical protein